MRVRRHSRVRRRKEQGYTLFSAALGVALMSYIAVQAVPLIARAQQWRFVNATITGINEIAQASKTFFVTPANARSWPADVATLAAGDFLSGFENRSGFGAPYALDVVGNSLIVSTTAPTEAQARQIAAYFGGLGTVTITPDENRVDVVFSAPGTDANHQALVPRDGSRDVFGPLTLRAGVSGIQMNGNSITNLQDMDSQGTITVRNAGSTGLLSSDIGAIDVLTTNDIRITP